MTSQIRSIAGGAVVAALLILPARAGNDWVSWPQKSYAVERVRVKDLIGTLKVRVKNGGPVTVDVSGTKARVAQLSVESHGNTLEIEGARTNAVWDWHKWFDFSLHDENNPKNLVVKLVVPKGMALKVEDMIGNAAIGDTNGPLHFKAAATTARIGQVHEAKISLAGSGRLDIARVAGPLDLEIAGSGRVKVGGSGRVDADLAGAGDAQFGRIDGGLKLDIAGSGDVAAQSVNGPVKIGIAGSGSIKIAQGSADPLKVSIVGSGNFDFGGNAVDPHLSAIGSGRVRLKSYTGHMSRSGNISVKVGGRTFDNDND